MEINHTPTFIIEPFLFAFQEKYIIRFLKWIKKL